MKTILKGRHFLLAICTATLAVAVFGQQTSTRTAPSVDRLRKDVTYLASDRLDGRRTGTSGAAAAAQYIASEFQRLGLHISTEGKSKQTRGLNPARFLHPFPYVAGVELGKKNSLHVRPETTETPARVSINALTPFLVGKDWMPLGLSSNGTVENTSMTFVGYGITDAELKYDDYTAASRGRIALAMMGTPDGDNPHGKFARHEDIRWKAIAARNAGAKALLIVTRETTLEADRLSRLRYDNRAGDAGLPVALISRQAATRLCGENENNRNVLAEVEGMVRSIIANQFRTPSDRYGLSAMPNIQDIPVSDNTVTISTDLVRREVTANNVIGLLEGADPVLKKEAIAIGAHYDHLGRGGEGSLAPKEGEIHHGADDNASGTAGLLELARLFSRQRPRRTLVFIAFSGEEEGLLGSNYYVNHPVVPLENTVAMINMDMIGRMKENKLIIGGVGTASEWREIVERSNLWQGLKVTPNGVPASSSLPLVVGANGKVVVESDRSKQFVLTLNEDGFGPSDHSSFYAKKIPVMFLWTGVHEDYHKPSDTADKINYEDEARILAFAARLIRAIDGNDQRPAYTVAKAPETTGRSMGFRVYLGTIPNYGGSGEGLLLDGVREDSPAAKAGLKAEDRVVKLAGYDVRNVEDYTYALGQMKPGQEYEVEILRGTERLTLRITPAARR